MNGKTTPSFVTGGKPAQGAILTMAQELESVRETGPIHAFAVRMPPKVVRCRATSSTR